MVNETNEWTNEQVYEINFMNLYAYVFLDIQRVTEIKRIRHMNKTVCQLVKSVFLLKQLTDRPTKWLYNYKTCVSLFAYYSKSNNNYNNNKYNTITLQQWDKYLKKSNKIVAKYSIFNTRVYCWDEKTLKENRELIISIINFINYV